VGQKQEGCHTCTGKTKINNVGFAEEDGEISEERRGEEGRNEEKEEKMIGEKG
jgi:hypothetical protein